MISGRDLGLIYWHDHAQHAHSKASNDAAKDHGPETGAEGLNGAAHGEYRCADAQGHATAIRVGDVRCEERGYCVSYRQDRHPLNAPISSTATMLPTAAELGWLKNDLK